MDGNCLLCAAGARAISRFDRRRDFRICPIQTPLGRAMVLHYGLAPDDPETWLYLAEGRACTSMEAIIRIGQRLGGIGRAYGGPAPAAATGAGLGVSPDRPQPLPARAHRHLRASRPGAARPAR